MVTLSQFTRANASTPTKTPTIPLPITLTPTSAAYPLPGVGKSSSDNTAYPAPQVDLSGGAQTNNSAPSSTPIPTEIPTPTPIVLANGWYLYTDPEGDFTFSYPPNTIFSAGMNKFDLTKNITIQFLMANTNGFQGMSIRIEPNPKHLTTEEFIAEIYEKNSLTSAPGDYKDFIKERQLDIDGLHASQVTIPGTNSELTIVFIYKNDIFVISPMHDSVVNNVDPKAMDLFFEILTSFNLKK
jgi:hypothetical protein